MFLPKGFLSAFWIVLVASVVHVCLAGFLDPCGKPIAKPFKIVPIGFLLTLCGLSLVLQSVAGRAAYGLLAVAAHRKKLSSAFRPGWGKILDYRGEILHSTPGECVICEDSASFLEIVSIFWK